MTATPALSTVAARLEALLAPQPIDDYGPNGLQVEASRSVTKIATGVTANLALIRAAAAWGADLLVVHHGIYWNGAPVTVTGALGQRIRALIEAEMSLIGYHLPLDAHPAVGNAHNLARAIGLTELSPAFEHRGIPVGCVGRFESPVTAGALRERLETTISPRALVFEGGPATIRTAGVVTGGAARDVREAIDRGLDLYITGEAGEYSQATAEEERIHFAACGHHRTERFGPEALAAWLSAEFPAIETLFIDIDNPV